MRTPSAVELFAAFFRLGLTGFGGPAMVAYIRELAVEKRRWLSEESFREGAALCQSLPGATSMQTAAYVGLRARGLRGAFAAYVGFGLPAFLLMLALSAAYGRARDVQPIAAAFRGLQVIVVAIVAHAAVNFGRTTIASWRDAVLCAAAAGYLWAGGTPVLAIGGAGIAGVLLYRSRGTGWQDAPAAGRGRRRRGLRDAALLSASAGAGLALLYPADRLLFDLAAVMLRVDLFAFGGGFGSLPLLLHQVVEVRRWLDPRTFLDGIALGQVTPGPIVITATFVGYQVGGLAGAVVATAAIFTPSLVLLVAAVPHLERLGRSPLFHRALRGILASFVGLLVAVALRFGASVPWSPPAALLCAAAFAALRLRADLLWVVLGGAALSALLL